MEDIKITKPATLDEMYDLFLKQQETISTQQATIEGLKLKETNISIAKVKKLEIPTKSVQSGGKEYQWQVPHFIHKGKKYTAEDAATDEGLVKEIVAVNGQGILKEQA